MTNHPYIAAATAEALTHAAQNYAIHARCLSRDQWRIAQLTLDNYAAICDELQAEGVQERPTLEDNDEAVARFINDIARATEEGWEPDAISVYSVKSYRIIYQRLQNVPELSAYRRALSFDHCKGAVSLMNAGLVASVQEPLNRAIKEKWTADEMRAGFDPETTLNRPPRGFTFDRYVTYLEHLCNGWSEKVPPEKWLIIRPLLEQALEIARQ